VLLVIRRKEQYITGDKLEVLFCSDIHIKQFVAN